MMIQKTNVDDDVVDVFFSLLMDLNCTFCFKNFKTKKKLFFQSQKQKEN